MTVINYFFVLFATIAFLGCNYNASNGMLGAPLPLDIDKDDTGFKDFTRRKRRSINNNCNYKINKRIGISSDMFLNYAKNIKPI